MRGAKFQFTGLDGKVYMLSKKQKIFCDEFLKPEKTGVEAARKAGYAGDGRSLAVTASKNLSKPNVTAYLNTKLEEVGLTDKEMDKQLLWLAQQFKDLRAKGAAVHMYYKKKGKFAPEKHEHSGEVKVVEVKDYS